MKLKYMLLCLLPVALHTLAADELSLEKVMQDPAWIGRIPDNTKLAEDGQSVYFQVNREIPLPSQWLRLDLGDGAVSEVTASQRAQARVAHTFSNGKMRIEEIEGDLWIANDGEKATPLISRTEPVTFVRFLDRSGFVFRERNNLFRYDLLTGSVIQVTNLVLEDDESEEDDYYDLEEKRLFGYVADLHQREAYGEEHEADKRTLGSLTKPKRTYLGEDSEFPSFWFDRDGRYGIDISKDMTYAAVTLAPGDVGLPTDYAQFINKDGQLKAKKARPRVTHGAKTWKMAVVQPKTGKIAWLDFSDLPEIKTNRLAAIQKDLTDAEKELLPKPRDKDTARALQLIPGGFHGHHFLVTAFSRDFKDRWVVLVNVRTMKKTVVYHQYDPAWVQYANRNIGTDHHLPGSASWVEGGGLLYFLSDESGYQHLYTYDVLKKNLKQLTKGKFEIYHPFLGPDNNYWYFHSNKVHPGEYHYYRMPKGGGKWEAFTKEEGFHLVKMSRDGKLMVDRFSKTNQPPTIRVRRGSGPWKELYDGRSEAFRAIDWVEPQVVSYLNRDGKKVFARLYKPDKPNGAGVVFVHGAGYLQNAHKGWSGYFREYMFHNLLLRKGYTVLDPDFQASAGYGRDWRTAIYRHMGGKDLNDVLDGAAWLVKSQGIDAERMGVYGGSYGGFITFMAMFNSPDTFKAGAALRPVSDWAHYNHWYTARILNTPTEDPKAYRQSSPINFAEGLKGRLMIAHGMVDDNVQYIDSVRLIQRFIELRKSGWDLASYPVEPHGFRAPSSWYDEYRRISELFEDTIAQ